MKTSGESTENGRPPGAALIAELKGRLDTSEPLLIAGLGDSLTYGWMVKRGFFDRFADALKGRFPKTIIEVVNAGIPGDTAEGGGSRLAPLLEKKPTLVTVQFGLNDMYQGVDPMSFGQTLDTIAKRLLATASIPVLVTSCPLNWDEGRRLCETFYDRIRQVAADNNLPCANLDHYWRNTAGPEKQWQSLVQADNVHPTDRGHALMAEGLVSYLLE